MDASTVLGDELMLMIAVDDIRFDGHIPILYV